MDLMIFYIVLRKYLSKNYFFFEFRYNLKEIFLLNKKSKTIQTELQLSVYNKILQET